MICEDDVIMTPALPFIETFLTDSERGCQMVCVVNFSYQSCQALGMLESKFGANIIALHNGIC